MSDSEKLKAIKKIIETHNDDVRYYSDSRDLAPKWAQRALEEISGILTKPATKEVGDHGG